MVAEVVREPVQLSNSRGHRYTAEEREAAFQLWRIAGGRSLRKTAALTTISHGTLVNWSRDDRWQERARQEDDEAAKLVRGAIRAVVVDEALRSIQVAVELRDDASGETPSKVRLDSAIWLAGIGGVVPTKVSIDLTKAPPSDRPALVTKDMTPDELYRLEMQYIQEQA